MARISGKLTGKSLGWDRGAIATAIGRVPAATGRVLIGRIAGIVNGLHHTVNEDNGETQTGLKGTFRGVSSLMETEPAKDGQKDAQGQPLMVSTGKPIMVTAGRCYLPGGLQEMVEAAYAEATKGEGNAKATVSFALDLYAIPASNKAGYSYDGDTLVEASEADPLAMLMDQAAGKAALPAPDASPADVGEDQPAEPAADPAPAKAHKAK